MICNLRRHVPKFTSLIRHVYEMAMDDVPYSDMSKSMFYCEPCLSSFPSFGTINKYIESHHSQHQEFRCLLCLIVCARGRDLDYHVQIVYANLRPHQCHKFDYSSKSKTGLNHLIRLMHDKIIRHYCDECDFSCYHKGVLVRHVRTHAKEKPRKCTQCDSSFSQKNNLTVHMKQVHSKKRDHACLTFSVAFTSNSKLNRHKNQKHIKPNHVI